MTPADGESRNAPFSSFALAAVAVIVVGVALYGNTVLREPAWGDGAELALAARHLGLTHPPGYPTYAWVGFLAGAGWSESAVVLNVLAAACVVAAVVLWVGLALELGVRPIATTAGALFLLASPAIWDIAVAAEVYSLNLLLLAGCCLLLVRSYFRGGRRRVLLAGVLYGTSLGCYLGNVLFLPGLLVLLWQGPSSMALRRLAGFLAVALCVLLPLLGWELWRSQHVLPMGTEFLPNTLPGLLRYVTGAQYNTLAPEPHSPGFFVQRTNEVVRYFGTQLLWIGAPIVILGGWSLWRRESQIAVATLLLALGPIGFFAFYDVDDYLTMLTPVHLVLGWWLACGFDAILIPARSRPRLGLSLGVALCAVALLPAAGQLPGRLARADEREVSHFLDAAFAALPADAVVIAEWERFTPLRYAQEVQGRRPDLLVIERQDDTRWYDFGSVEDWPYVDSAPFRGRRIFVDDVHLGPQMPYRVVGKRGEWHEITFK